MCVKDSKVVLVLRYQGFTFKIHNVIKENNISNVPLSPIQSKKQDIKNSRGLKVGSNRKRGSVKF